MWSSAAGAHLLQGSMCCVFRDGILQTLVVTSGYLSYCCLSIISNQSAHSPLTSDINKAFGNCHSQLCSCGSVVEHRVSSAKGHGFSSQGTHILTINV